MGHAADLGDTEFKSGLVATKIIADQLALPILQKVEGVFSGSAGAEVVNDRCQVRELAGGVGPDIGAMGLLLAGREHRNRGFVGMDHVLGKHRVAQGIDQRLQLHTTVADPLGQGRAGDDQTGSTENRFLAVER